MLDLDIDTFTDNEEAEYQRMTEGCHSLAHFVIEKGWESVRPIAFGANFLPFWVWQYTRWTAPDNAPMNRTERYVPPQLQTEHFYRLLFKECPERIRVVPMPDHLVERVVVPLFGKDALKLSMIPKGQRTQRVCYAAIEAGRGFLYDVPLAVLNDAIVALSMRTQFVPDDDKVSAPRCGYLFQLPYSERTASRCLVAAENDVAEFSNIPLEHRTKLILSIMERNKGTSQYGRAMLTV